MYFESRHEAGEKLAEELFHAYAQTNTVIVVTDVQSLLVAEPIAERLSLPIVQLLVGQIGIPGEPDSIGSVDQAANFSYNSDMSSGQIADYEAEFHNQIEANKMDMMHRIHEQMSDDAIEPHDLNDKNIILVFDGLKDTAMIDAITLFLKPVRLGRIIAAVPVISVPAVDKLHLAADEMRILDVKKDYFSTDHYYEDNTVLDEVAAKALLNRHKFK